MFCCCVCPLSVCAVLCVSLVALLCVCCVSLAVLRVSCCVVVCVLCVCCVCVLSLCVSLAVLLGVCCAPRLRACAAVPVWCTLLGAQVWRTVKECFSAGIVVLECWV